MNKIINTLLSHLKKSNILIVDASNILYDCRDIIYNSKIDNIKPIIVGCVEFELSFPELLCNAMESSEFSHLNFNDVIF